MHPDRDFDPEAPPPPNEADLAQDLELTTLYEAMASGDRFLYDVARTAILSGLSEEGAITYRQRILADCLEHPEVTRQLYDLAVEAVESERRFYFVLYERASPNTILHRSIGVLELFVGLLRRLRVLCEEQAGGFRSDGFGRFFEMIAKELDEPYFDEVRAHLGELKFRAGMLMSAQLGKGNKGTGYVLRRSAEPGGWARRFAGRSGQSFQIPDRDEAGLEALAELRARGTNLVANALARSTDHILAFFKALRAELAFYVGCLNLHARLAGKDEPACFPAPLPAGAPALSFEGLYDVCLSLHLPGRAVGNDADATGKRLVVVTGANRGGKSTFLRSVGLAQLMTQCGMFVGARRFQADAVAGVFTHYKREEDRTMESGKLDEELARMSAVVDMISPGAMLLCNESFASTNHREGSEIAGQVVGALLDSGVKVLFVTHLFDLAIGLRRSDVPGLFLRAERRPDGTRTYRVVEGDPEPTSHGADLYRRIFTVPEGTPTGTT